VIFYADQATDSMRRAIEETHRRRKLQLAYNVEHDITPRGIVKSLDEVVLSTAVADAKRKDGADVVVDAGTPSESLAAAIEAEMLREARDLNYEKAASLRDRLDEIRLALAATENRTAPRRHRSRSTDE
jgi:excinuclease ABC subunit B